MKTALKNCFRELDRKVVFIVLRFTAGELGNSEVCLPLLFFRLFQNAGQCVTREHEKQWQVLKWEGGAK